MSKTGPKLQALQVDQFMGLNTLDDPKNIDPSYSPYMVNMDITSTGKLQTRYGYETFCTIGGATGALSGLMPYYRTYDDNSAVDQSQDPNHAYANTYTTPVAPVSETATNKCSFTPTKTGILAIAVYVVAKGTGDWSLTLHDASNNVLGSFTFPNASLTNGAWNYFAVPYTWTSGTLHFHVTSTVADGTLKCNTAGDLSTASFLETYSTKGDYLIVFHKGTAYKVTNTNTTPSSIGTYGTVGTDTGQVRGVVHNNLAVFSDGYVANPGNYWNATTLSSLNSGTIYPKYFGQFNSRLWCSAAHSSTAYYSDSATTDTNLSTNYITLGLGDGTDITAYVSANDKLQVLKENTIHAINFGYDSSYNIAAPKEQPIISSSGGAFAAGSTVPVYNYIYFLSKLGFQNYGNLEQGVQASLPLPMSFIIDNTVSQINFLLKDEISATFFGGKYLCSAPLGISTTNNYMFVYNEVVKRRYGNDNWTLYQGIPARQLAIFRDANLRDQLLFASAFEPTVYKFNTSFSDNGYGYDRIWRSKTFQFGERTRFYYIDIEGSKPINTEIDVTCTVDGIDTAPYTITDSNFISSTVGGGYIGDSYVGDTNVGGGYYGSETVPMYKFRARIRLPDEAVEGYSMYFQIQNNADNAGWRMTRFKVVYELLPEDPTYEYTVTN